ncbi:MAG: regulatory protein RecX [Chitinophagales bacterium]|nr:MAG: regulatory protein RecX [Chitinophagales bacterium]
MPVRQQDISQIAGKIERYCASAERCRQDVIRKLSQSGVEPATIEKLIRRLERRGFLDEKRYARLFAREKFHLSAWGKIKIRHALRQKGISDDLIEVALEEIPQEEYLATLRKLFSQKIHALAATDKASRKEKVFRYLAGRGFEPDLITRLMENDG